MTESEKIELQCRRLLAAKDNSEKVSRILSESVGYLGLAQAYVELSNELFCLKKQISENEQ
jgi:hypothetical protein